MPNKPEAITPGDLLLSIVGNDPKAITSALRGKSKAEDKYASRTIARNKEGKAVVKKVEYTKEHLAKEKAKKAAAKKTKKAKKEE